MGQRSEGGSGRSINVGMSDPRPRNEHNPGGSISATQKETRLLLLMGCGTGASVNKDSLSKRMSSFGMSAWPLARWIVVVDVVFACK